MQSACLHGLTTPTIFCNVEVIRFEPPRDYLWNFRITATVSGPEILEGIELDVTVNSNSGNDWGPDTALTDVDGQYSEEYGTNNVCDGDTEIFVEIVSDELGVSTNCSVRAEFECDQA